MMRKWYVGEGQEDEVREDTISVSVPFFYAPNINEVVQGGMASFQRSIAMTLGGMVEEAQTNYVFAFVSKQKKMKALEMVKWAHANGYNEIQ